jgi:hypothetical protein
MVHNYRYGFVDNRRTRLQATSTSGTPWLLPVQLAKDLRISYSALIAWIGNAPPISFILAADAHGYTQTKKLTKPPPVLILNALFAPKTDRLRRNKGYIFSLFLLILTSCGGPT